MTDSPQPIADTFYEFLELGRRSPDAIGTHRAKFRGKEVSIKNMENLHFACIDVQAVNFVPPDQGPYYARVENVEFYCVHFEQTLLENIHFKNCSFRDCLFKNCHLSDVHLEDCHFISCIFINSSLTVEASKCVFTDTTMKTCDLKVSEFRECDMREVFLRNSAINSIKLLDTMFTGNVEHCDGIDAGEIKPVKDIDAKILEIIEAEPLTFFMEHWVSVISIMAKECLGEVTECKTALCRAGHAVNFQNSAVKDMTKKYDYGLIGSIVYAKSYGMRKYDPPNWYSTDWLAIEAMVRNAYAHEDEDKRREIALRIYNKIEAARDAVWFSKTPA